MSEAEYPKPADRPRVRAIANIQYPRRVRNLGNMALPPPHMDEEAMGQGWLGADVYGSREESAESQSMYCRFPIPAMEMMRDICLELSDIYQGNISAFIRHAVYELLWLHLQRRNNEGKDPASLRWLANIRALRHWAFSLDSERQQLKFLQSLEEHLAKAVHLKLINQVNTNLSELREMLSWKQSEAGLHEFRLAVGKSEVIGSAIDAVVKAWARSESKHEQKEAQEWEAWWDNLRAE